MRDFYFNQSDDEVPSNLYIRPNPDGRINRKPDGQIIDQTAELIKNRTAEYLTVIRSIYEEMRFDNK